MRIRNFQLSTWALNLRNRFFGGVLLVFSMLSCLATAQTPVAPSTTFETGKVGHSIALMHLEDRDAVLIAIAHGEDGIALYTTQGIRIWSSQAHAHLVAPQSSKFLACNCLGETAQFEILVGHGGKHVFQGPKAMPALIAATTLQRTSLAALGPVRIEGSTVRAQDREIQLPIPIVAMAAVATTAGNGAAPALIATVTESGRVDIYPFDAIHGPLLGP